MNLTAGFPLVEPLYRIRGESLGIDAQNFDMTTLKIKPVPSASIAMRKLGVLSTFASFSATLIFDLA